MKIRLIPENKIYAGTPSNIVRKITADAIFLYPRTPEDYLKQVSKRLPLLKIEGDNFNEQCISFVNGLLKIGAAEIVLDNTKP